MTAKKPDNNDFTNLTKRSPELARHVKPNRYGNLSIDFADPAAVKALNRALLLAQCGLEWWDIPEGFLCPPVPGRAQYIEEIARLLAADKCGTSPRGEGVRILDIGTGANLIYPIIGHARYGWSFVGSELDAEAVKSAKLIIEKNASLRSSVEIRRQYDPSSIYKGIILPGERFDAALCNPPFHASAAEAREGTQRKWKNLGHDKQEKNLNFGGTGNELWCKGGEAAFAKRMIDESVSFAAQCRWFTILIAKDDHLRIARRALTAHSPSDVRTLDMELGNKKSRVLAWSFR